MTRILQGFLLSFANWSFCYLNLAGIIKLKCERKNKRYFRSIKKDAIVQMTYLRRARSIGAINLQSQTFLIFGDIFILVFGFHRYIFEIENIVDQE